MKHVFLCCISLVIVATAVCAYAAEREEGDLRLELGPLFMWRFSTASYPLLTENTTPSGPHASLETSGLNEGVHYGVQGGLEWKWDEHSSIEFAAFWTSMSSHNGTVFDPSWSVSQATDAVYDPYPGTDLNTGNSSGLLALETTMSSQLIGAEINIKSDQWLDLSWLKYYFGFRYFHYSEHLEAIAYDDPNDYLGTDNDIDRVEIRTWNNLYGGQIGAELQLPLMQDLSFGADVWFGLFANDVVMYREFASDDLATNYREQDTNKLFFSYGFGVSPEIAYQPYDNIAFTIGGDFILLHGVSETGKYYETIADLQNNRTFADDTVIFLGVNAGIVILF